MSEADSLLTTFRRELHRFPELSGKEEKTASRIVAFLKEHAPDFEIFENIGGTGVLAVQKGSERGKTLVVRCELDALPISQKSGASYASENPGVAHLCGHDGHMDIVCGVANRFQESPVEKGTLVLLFQPAEETGEGSQRVLDDSRFQALNPDQIIALHNIPGKPLGTILIRDGIICPASTGVEVRLEGRSSHASEPEKGKAPWPAMVRISESMARLEASYTSQGIRALATLVGAQTGGADYGVSPGDGIIRFTLRSGKTRILEHMVEELREITKRECDEMGLGHNIELSDWFDATQNTPELTSAFVEHLEKEGFEVERITEPFPWSEDFGRFTSAFKGFLFGIGSGEETAPLHAPEYDFPDELTPTATEIFETWLRKQFNT